MKSSDSEAVLKKRRLTLIKKLLLISILLVTATSFCQDDKERKWSEEKEYLEYKKGEKYKGPEDWYGSAPSNIKEEDYYGQGGNNYSQGNSSSGSGGRIQYSPQQIQRDRQKRYQGFDRGGGNGNLKFDPKVERPEPIEIPDVDAPDVDLPSLDIDVDAPTISPVVWKVLLFIVIFIAALWIAYLIIKNRRPSNKKVIVDVENDWNPEVITKTELELRLEAAIADEDYRECVRIYFTFILKELIRKGWIRWKKEKTNHHYVMEMNGKPNAFYFMECVRIYDLVWYGDYKIDADIYSLLKPELENYYKSLDPVND